PYCESSFRRSEPCPCCIAFWMSVATRSTVFLGVCPSERDCSSVQAPRSTVMATRLILGSVDKTVLLDPRHHLAQARADLLDRQLGGHAPLAEEAGRPGPVLEHELLRVLAGL